MSEPKFTYGGAVAHGWAMTKKYAGTIVVLVLIYLGVNVPGGVMNSFSGAEILNIQELHEVIPDEERAGRFVDYLKDAGYINDAMMVQKEWFEQITGPELLILPPEFEGEHAEIYSFLAKHQYNLPFPKPVYYLLMVFLWLLNTVVGIGMLKASISIARDQPPSFGELFAQWHLIIPYLIGGLCYSLAVMGGFILLIIPGIILCVAFSMYTFLIVDQGLGPIASLNRSREITKGSRIRLFFFGFVLCLLNLGGLLCLGVGLLVTMAISWIASAYVYDRLLNWTASPVILEETVEDKPKPLPPPYRP